MALPVPVHEVTQLSPIGLDLYSGSCGIALFFAMLAHATSDARYRQVSEQALTPVLEALRTRKLCQVLAGQIGIGGGAGLGSIIYALVRIARLTRRSEYLSAAHRALQVLEISVGNHEDVVSGTAGAILGLLPVGSRSSLLKAKALGDRLL